MVLGYKRIYIQGRALCGFSRILMELCGLKVQLAPPHGNLINGVANPEIVYSFRNMLQPLLSPPLIWDQRVVSEAC